MKFIVYSYAYHDIVVFYFTPTSWLFGVSFEDPLVAIHLGPFVIEIWKFFWIQSAASSVAQPAADAAPPLSSVDVDRIGKKATASLAVAPDRDGVAGASPVGTFGGHR